MSQTDNVLPLQSTKTFDFKKNRYADGYQFRAGHGMHQLRAGYAISLPTESASGSIKAMRNPFDTPISLSILPPSSWCCYFTFSMAKMGALVVLLAALLVCIHVQEARGTSFVLTNQCAYTVWAAGIPVGGGQQLATGQSWTVQVPAGTQGARFWGRTGCSFDQNGRGSCTTGDCGGLLNCQASGSVPTTLVEYSLNQYQNLDFFDISLVDGFNVPLSVTPTHITSSNPKCQRVACTADINSQCPAQLKVTDGCKSACAAFNTPQYCCTGDYVNNCSPSDYSKFFKGQCPQAYSYAKDDSSSTFTCPSDTTDYNVVFCG